MSSEPSAVADDVPKALADVRDDKTSTDFALFGFEGNDSVVLIGHGTDGVEGMRSKLPSDDVAYGLLRFSYTYDNAGGGYGDTVVVKFLFIYYRPENKLSLTRKRNMGRLEGYLKSKLLSPFHDHIEIEDPKELTTEKVEDRVSKLTQKHANTKSGNEGASNFLLNGRAFDAANDDTSRGAASFVPKHEGGHDELGFDDWEGINEEIAAVRSDSDPKTWVLLGYQDEKTVALIGSGDDEDPVAALDAALPEKSIAYGLVRLTEQYDRTVAVRFVFVEFLDSRTPIRLKGKATPHKQQVNPLFRPFNTDLKPYSKGELTLELVMDKLGKLSGTKSAVTDRKSTKKEAVYERKMLGGTGTETQSLVVHDEEGLQKAIASVRADNETEITWVVAINESDASLKLSNAGGGLLKEGTSNFRAAMMSDETTVSYGLLRTEATVDMSSVVKFLYVTYQGSKLSPKLKGQIGTIRGAVAKLFGSKNAEIFADRASDLTDEEMSKRLGGINLVK